MRDVMMVGSGMGLADLLAGAVIGGFLLLCCGGLWLAARHGRGRGPLQGAYWLLLFYALELALVWALPPAGGGLWRALGVAGLVGAGALAFSGPRLWRLWDEAEARRLSARDCL